MKRLFLSDMVIFFGTALLLLAAALPDARFFPVSVFPIYLVESIGLFLGISGILWLTPLPTFRFQKLFVLGIFCILGGLLLGLFFFPTTHGFGILKSWFLFPLGLLGIFAPRLRTFRERNLLLAGWLLALSLIAAQAALQWFSHDLTYDSRLHGVFTSPNSLALFLFPAPLLSGYFFRIARTRAEHMALLVLFAFHLWILWLTFSYTTWIALIVGIGLWKLARDVRRFRILGICFLALLALSLTQLNNPKLTNWFSSPQRSSLASREMIWQASFQMIHNHPLLGIGAGNFQTTYLAYQKFFPPYLEWAVPEPHNLILAFWLESGFLGLIGFFILVYFLFSTVRTPKNQSDPLVSFLWIYGVGLLVQGCFDTPFWSLSLAYSFWFALLLVLVSRNK